MNRTATSLDRKVGPSALTVTLKGVALDLSTVGPVTIRHGRADVEEQPQAATCSLSILAGALDVPPAIGDQLDVQLGPDAVALFGMDATAEAAASWRFTGTVTDPRARLDGRGRAVYAITAVSRRAKLGRTFVGDVPWPAELDGDRAQRILDLVADVVPVAPLLDPGTVTVVARDVDRQAALGLLDQLAQDANATLVELRDGTLDWHDAEHRRNATPDLQLDATEVLSPAEWAQSLAGMVNQLTVAYGDADPQAEVFVEDAESADPVAGLGPFTARVSTQLATQSDAESFARLVVARRARPWWRLDQLVVDLVDGVDAATARQLLAIEFGDLVEVTGFPSSGPFTTKRLWVEGWTEQITAKSWRLSLVVSDYARTVAPARWVDVPTEVTWDAVDPSLTWNGAASWDPGTVDAGRWADYPADVAWADRVGDLTTWADLP